MCFIYLKKPTSLLSASSSLPFEAGYKIFVNVLPESKSPLVSHSLGAALTAVIAQLISSVLINFIFSRKLFYMQIGYGLRSRRIGNL